MLIGPAALVLLERLGQSSGFAELVPGLVAIDGGLTTPRPAKGRDEGEAWQF
jgi:hypothetical protein